MWPKEGWPAQHGARERREVSLEVGGNYHGGAPGGRGYLGDKKRPSTLAMDVIRSMCTPNGISRERRWLEFEGAAAAAKQQGALVLGQRPVLCDLCPAGVALLHRPLTAAKKSGFPPTPDPGTAGASFRYLLLHLTHDLPLTPPRVVLLPAVAV
jgi:hypothetical protein